VLGLGRLHVLDGATESLHVEAQEALRAAEELEDEFTLAQAWNLLGQVEGSVHGSMATGEEAWRRALELAERSGFAAERADAMGWLMISAIFGPLPVPDGIARCREFLDRAGDDPTIRAFCCVEQAVLEAMSGEVERSRELLAQGHRAIADLGLTVWAANNAQEAFFVEMLAGDAAAAADTLRASFDTLERLGERGFLSTIAGFLAQALYALGEHDEAARFSRASEEAASPEDVYSQVLWRSARAKLLARRGDHEEAERLGREAVELVERSDLLNSQGDALLDLAEVLRLAGREDEARATAAEAARRFERKGNLPSLERARTAAA
jgi:tetratricopeptide (TPR) repeat protein